MTEAPDRIGWRLRDRGGNVVAVSVRSLPDKRACIEAIEAFKANAPSADIG